MTLSADKEGTEVWTGVEDIISKSLKLMSGAKCTFDLCTDATGPGVTMCVPSMKMGYAEMGRRGVKIRHITAVNKDNLEETVEFMKIGQVRHMDGIVGNFIVADGTDYAGATTTENEETPKLLVSNVSFFVKQQQYFFDLLWAKAIPAEQRIREIQEGKEPEKTEIIQDTKKSIQRAFDIMNYTEKELLIIFATPRTFSLAMTTEAARVYREMSDHGINIKILVPKGNAKGGSTEGAIAKLKQTAPNIDLRISDSGMNTRITILVSDRKRFMSWELKDDTLDDPYLAGGVATYSNIESLATSYATIFENLWLITEFAENLRATNAKLEANEKAMREFIDIAAHELRTPIQPILGLAETLQHATNRAEQKRLLKVIAKNAQRLERLAEDILDVARVESSRGLILSKEKTDLYRLVNTVANDFRRGLNNNNAIIVSTVYDNEEQDNGSTIIKNESEKKRQHCQFFVQADPGRLTQVISNLLSNAIKFSQDSNSGKIMIKIGTLSTPNADNKKGKIVGVSITDHGQGIDPEIFPELFERFASNSEKGTGLGLYLSKKIVEAHGGKIWAENNSNGTGATFTFTLPITTN